MGNTHCGSNSRWHRPAVPILSAMVPVLTTDSFDWTCNDNTPAKHSHIYRGFIPLLVEGSAKETNSESTKVILDVAFKTTIKRGLCNKGYRYSYIQRGNQPKVTKHAAAIAA